MPAGKPLLLLAGLLAPVLAHALTVSSTSPPNAARAALASGSVSATFNRAVTSGSAAALRVFGSQRGDLRSGHSGSTVAGGNTILFAPGYAFQPGETVQATVTTAATGTAGGTLAAGRVWQFTAAAGVGPGTFGGGFDPAVGSGPQSVAVGDVDGDGDPDLLTANNNSSGTVSVRLNTGHGFFGGGADYAVGSNTDSVVLGDVDGDGDLDFLATNFLGNTVSVRLNQPPPNLTVSTGSRSNHMLIPAGSYGTITVTATGVAELGGPVVVDTGLGVSGTLFTACQTLTGPGSFTLAAGGTLGICDPAGISASGATGAVQLAGTRSYSPAASYEYDGTAAQRTGDGLPPQVLNLTNTNPADLTLTAPISVTQVLTVGAAGNLLLAGQPLTLLSSSIGTALVVNSGTGVVTGTATVQRYTDPSLNAGLGYRHYSAPVSNTTVADLTTAGFTPVVNARYNTSPTPSSVQPFPTVFGYDERRAGTITSTYGPFTQGWYSPQALTDPLTPGRGYSVNIAATALVDFRGTPGTGDLTLALTRGSSGWQLVGNPYPAPLDWSEVAPADRDGLEAAIHVEQSSGRYTGAYRGYVNGQSTTGSNNPLLATAQGFFVRVAQGRSTASLTFRNAQRVTDYATAQGTDFQRQLADERPVLRLALSGGGYTDGWVAYAQAEATTGFDGAYDAGKLPNPSGLNLSSVTTAGQLLAIDGQPAFTAATVLPLLVAVPAAGRYTFGTAALAHLPAGLTAYLRDARTGQALALAPGTDYGFDVPAADAGQVLAGRFTVQFAPTAVLAATPAALAQNVRLYPNPARGYTTLSVPGVAGATQLSVVVLNPLGQVVLRQAAALPAGGTTLTLPTTGLATGVYVVRLTAGGVSASQRLTVE